MPTKKIRLLGCISLAIFIMLLGMSSPAHADTSTPGDGYTAPAPTKFDRAGLDQDEYCVPDDLFMHPQYGFGSYWVNGRPMGTECQSTKGASSVAITTDFNSGTWTLDFTDDQSGEEAKNTYWVDVSQTCETGGGGVVRYHDATANVANQDDITDLMFSVWPQVIDMQGVVSVVDNEVAYDIPDGSTAAMRLMEYESTIPGLRPGRYLVKFWLSHSGEPWNGDVVKQMRLTVPSCDGGTGGTSQKAGGALRRVGCKAIKVTANALRYDATPMAHYRVYRHARGHRPHHRNFAVAAGNKRVLVLKKPPRRAVVFNLKVQRPDGNWRWLDTQWVPRCR